MERENEFEPQRSVVKGLWRLFFAIELPKDVRAEAAGYIKRLRASAPAVKASWEREEKLHLTLKFLGNVAPEKISELTQALERTASPINSFELALRGTGAFPPKGLPRVLWLGVVDSSGHLSELHRSLEDECARIGFAREQKRFHPHLTIARLRHPEGARALADLHKQMEFETKAFRVSEVILMRSILGPQGSSYTQIKKQGMNDKRGKGENGEEGKG